MMLEVENKETDLKKKELKEMDDTHTKCVQHQHYHEEIGLSQHSGLSVNWQSIYHM